jgi:putative Ca2+/H+ antiporter (TMEM165/GDT1 family)
MMARIAAGQALVILAVKNNIMPKRRHNMSHHMAIPDPQTNITDMYVFQKPGDPTKSILVLNVYPDAPRQATTLNPQASYELKIDTNGDAQADIAFHILFAPVGDRQQTATVYHATGVSAETLVWSGR